MSGETPADRDGEEMVEERTAFEEIIPFRWALAFDVQSISKGLCQVDEENEEIQGEEFQGEPFSAGYRWWFVRTRGLWIRRGVRFFQVRLPESESRRVPVR
jgi:hypothetical protein